MGSVAHDLDTSKPQICDFFKGFKDRELNKCVGAVGEYHVFSFQKFKVN